MTVIGSYSRCIVCWELAWHMRAQEVAETIAAALQEAPGKSPRIVRDNGSQFVAKGWLRSALKYVRPVAHHGGNLETLLADEKSELTEAAVRWK